MRVGLLLNPAAGRHRTDNLVERVVACLRAAEASVEVVRTAARGEAQTMAASLRPGQWDRLVIAGGDGTVAEVLNGRPDHTPLAIIPAGTANVLARELGLRLHDPVAIAETILTGEPIPIDLGTCNGRRFSLMAGIGFDAETVREVPPSIKQVLGAPAYVVSALKTLVERPQPIRYRIQGPEESLRATGLMLVVANTSTYGGALRLAPLASVTDGLLDLCLFRERSAAAFVLQWLRVLAGLHLTDPHFVYRRVTTVTVSCSPEAAVQLDGDYFGRTPVTIGVEPRAVTILRPRPLNRTPSASEASGRAEAGGPSNVHATAAAAR